MTVDAILEAAVRILLERGYQALTTKTVADLAGVSVGSLYQYFPNKQAILAEIIRRRAREIYTSLQRAAAGAENVPDLLSRLASEFVAQKRAKLPLSLALKHPKADVAGRQIMREGFQQCQDLVTETIERILDRPLTAAQMQRISIALASLEGMVSTALEYQPDALNAPELEATVTRMMIAAIDLGA